MRLAACVLLAVELGSVLARPNPRLAQRFDIAATVQGLGEVEGAALATKCNKAEGAKAGDSKVGEAKVGEAKVGEAKAGEAKAGEAKAGEAKTWEANAGEGKAKPAVGEAAAEGEAKEGEVENEVRLKGAFGAAVALQGGDIKQDTEFTKSAIGTFEYEFQAAAGDELTVTENKTPAAPPAGFVAVEPSSFKVALKQSKGVGLTLSKIDYIFDPQSAALPNVDLTQAKVGRLCEATGTFVIDEALGELEFEAEENETTLNLNKKVVAEGEWGIFLPVAAVAGMFNKAVAAGNATVARR
ncbi:hypothetical protein BCR34DRAFT_612880 [Clohesyomyces aquaticus]|uniref:Uncharacterized protein n=1 Tax=Clohesyomyces aquaticus TaxID=1231657 RepID=A0A1Y1ZX07_9PLEO|nr:hypothetical protein BCR34DRAFT_612880 [Clohesyomyces aquaticus]